MTFDTTALKEGTDLLALIGNDTTLKHVASTKGGEWAGPCPFCGGKDRFRVWPNQEGGAGFWCRQCRVGGDAIAYLQKRDGLSFEEACERLGGGKVAPSARFPQGTSSSPAPPLMFPETEAPSAGFGAMAREFVGWAQGKLWANEEALAYLHDRGLSDDTIRSAGLGYNPGLKNPWRPARKWDMPHDVWLPRGWVIPCEHNGHIWYLKTRRHDEDIEADARRKPDKEPPKYALACQPGRARALYGLEHLQETHFTDCVICEGEFDALLLRQHVGSLVGCVALGSASKGLDMQAIDQLVTIRRWWVALDADKAGQAGAKKLLAVSARIHLLPVPGDNNDVTDAWKDDHDLVAWVLPAIGPNAAQRAERRLMWLKYHLEKLGDRAEGDVQVWRVWQALLEEYNQMILSLGPQAQPMLLRIEEQMAAWNARFHHDGKEQRDAIDA